MPSVDPAEIAQVFRSESGRAVASLVRFFGDIDLAEEAVQDAFVIALEKWPETGLPPSPAGWIITTARHRGLDHVRRESSRDTRQAEAHRLQEPDEPEEVGPVADDQLRLIFTCCHPALAPTAQVALTLRLIGGLQTPEIARAFLVPEATMAQRIVRAKNKIKANHIPYRVPSDAELPDRLKPVLAVVYLVFNEGHVASQGDELTRASLCADAIRLARLLAELMPDELEVHGLLALLLLTESRRPARTATDGSLVRLADQDRTRWNPALVAEGQAIVRACLRRNLPGPYQIQAAIAAVHSDAPTAADTAWDQVVALYDQLLVVSPSPVVALNRAIAVAELDGPAPALVVLENLADELDQYHLFHAARANLLARLDRGSEAMEAYDAALALTANGPERALLEQARAAIAAGEPG
ncbi:MAG TPA: RNA polymerase sigma factor [Acidimicrobiales bacterium]